MDKENKSYTPKTNTTGKAIPRSVHVAKKTSNNQKKPVKRTYPKKTVPSPREVSTKETLLDKELVSVVENINIKKTNTKKEPSIQEKVKIPKQPLDIKKESSTESPIKKNNKKSIFYILVTIIISVVCIVSAYIAIGYLRNNKDIFNNADTSKEVIKEINSHYNSIVITNKDSNIYTYSSGKYNKIGIVSKGIKLELASIEIDAYTTHFKITSMDEEYYISYSDVDTSDSIEEKNTRYKNYIPFNKNIVTKEKVSFYKDNNKVFTLDKSYSLPIYIMQEDGYYVEFLNDLYYVKKEDVKEEKNYNNSSLSIAKEISVIAYHFIYDPKTDKDCNQIICHTKEQFTDHMTYIKDNNYFTPTMNELELYMKKELNLPKKSVFITIDDGWYASLGSSILTELKLNGTIFIIAKYYDPASFKTDYVEVHSHTYDMHNAGACPGGQGGGLKCLPKQEILDDLKKSIDKTGATALCYPFYEYNDYTISLVKEAGLSMAFAGYGAGGLYKATPGGNRYTIPRYTFINTSTVTELENTIKPK